MPAGATLARRRFVSGCAKPRRNKRARPGVWPLQRFKLRQESVLCLAHTAARRACPPEPLWRGALCKRLRGSPAEQASSAGRVAAAAVQTRAGDYSGLADTAARRACPPEPLWRGALCKRPRGSPAEHASSAGRAAVAALQTRQASVLGLADTAARRACPPERLWRGVRAGRPRQSPAEQASSAGRVAIIVLHSQAGECSGPC